MMKVDGIDLAASVATIEVRRAAEIREKHQAAVHKEIDILLNQIALKNEVIVQTIDLVSRQAKEGKELIARLEADLELDEKRLRAIKKGNWNALDPDYGRPQNGIEIH